MNRFNRKEAQRICIVVRRKEHKALQATKVNKLITRYFTHAKPRRRKEKSILIISR